MFIITPEEIQSVFKIRVRVEKIAYSVLYKIEIYLDCQYKLRIVYNFIIVVVIKLVVITTATLLVIKANTSQDCPRYGLRFPEISRFW